MLTRNKSEVQEKNVNHSIYITCNTEMYGSQNIDGCSILTASQIKECRKYHKFSYNCSKNDSDRPEKNFKLFLPKYRWYELAEKASLNNNVKTREESTHGAGGINIKRKFHADVFCRRFLKYGQF